MLCYHRVFVLANQIESSPSAFVTLVVINPNHYDSMEHVKSPWWIFKELWILEHYNFPHNWNTTFLFWIVHCGTRNRCIVGFVRLVYRAWQVALVAIEETTGFPSFCSEIFVQDRKLIHQIDDCSSQCNSFEDWAPVDFIYGHSIFKRVAVTLTRMIGYQQSGSCSHCQGDTHPILFVKYLSSGELLRQMRWMPVLWWMVPWLLGPHLQTFLSWYFKLDRNFSFIWHKFIQLNITKFCTCHDSCRGMCKILWWYDAWNGIRTKVILLKNLFAIERSFMK